MEALCKLNSKSRDLIHIGTSDPGFFKVIFTKFKKKKKKSDLANYLSHKHAKSYVQIF
jgi:hypothetical protein